MILAIVVFTGAVLLARLVRAAVVAWLGPGALPVPQPALAHERPQLPSRDA